MQTPENPITFSRTVRRQLVSWHDLPPKVAAEDFGYVEGEDRYSYRFFKWKGTWYDVYEFERLNVEASSPFAPWTAVQTDSCFSAMVVRFVGRDLEEVQAAYCHW